MAHLDADQWNARYLSKKRGYSRRQPYPLLSSYADQLPSGGLALDIAAGAVTDGLFLAARGLRVIAMDISDAGLRLGQQRARELSLPLSPVVMDLSAAWLPPASFDVILNFYYLSRPLFDIYRRALKPGGWLFFETFVQETGKRGNSAHYLEPGELLAVFQDWQILHIAETWQYQANRRHSSGRIAQMVAKKPFPEGRSQL